MKKVAYAVLISHLVYPASGRVFTPMIYRLSTTYVKKIAQHYSNTRFLGTTPPITMIHLQTKSATNMAYNMIGSVTKTSSEENVIPTLKMIDQYPQSFSAHLVKDLILNAYRCNNSKTEERIPLEVQKYMVNNVSLITLILESLEKDINTYSIVSTRNKIVSTNTVCYEAKKEELIEIHNELKQFETSLIGLQCCFEFP